MDHIDWSDLTYVLAVNRHRSYVSAGKTLGVTHTTVSRRVAALESALGTRLFERQLDGLAATAAGQELLSAATKMEEELLGVAARLSGKDVRLSGTLRVTTLDIIATRFVDDFRSFQERYPEVDLEISINYAVISLARHEADVAIRATNKPPSYLVGRRIGRAEYAVYGARRLIESYGAKTPLQQFPWIAWDERVQSRTIDQWMRKHAPEARVTCRVDSNFLLLAAMQAGIGLGVYPCFAADPHKDLVRLAEVDSEIGVDLWLLTHSELRNTARVKAFMDHMGSALSVT